MGDNIFPQEFSFELNWEQKTSTKCDDDYEKKKNHQHERLTPEERTQEEATLESVETMLETTTTQKYSNEKDEKKLTSQRGSQLLVKSCYSLCAVERNPLIRVWESDLIHWQTSLHFTVHLDRKWGFSMKKKRINNIRNHYGRIFSMQKMVFSNFLQTKGNPGVHTLLNSRCTLDSWWSRKWFHCIVLMMKQRLMQEK